MAWAPTVKCSCSALCDVADTFGVMFEREYGVHIMPKRVMPLTAASRSMSGTQKYSGRAAAVPYQQDTDDPSLTRLYLVMVDRHGACVEQHAVRTPNHDRRLDSVRRLLTSKLKLKNGQPYARALRQTIVKPRYG